MSLKSALKFLKLLKPVNTDEFGHDGDRPYALVFISHVMLFGIWVNLALSIISFSITPAIVRMIVVFAITYTVITVTINLNLKRQQEKYYEKNPY